MTKKLQKHTFSLILYIMSLNITIVVILIILNHFVLSTTGMKYKSQPVSTLLESQETIISIFLKDQDLTNFRKLNTHISYIPLPDTRLLALRKFLKQYNSPLYDYASDILQQADKNKQDWRILVSIAGVESNFGRITQHNSYNAWGWRGGNNGNFSSFHDWQDAITYITQKFTQGYGESPNPYDIYKTYCPPCTTAWPNAVVNYMKELSIMREQINKQIIKQRIQR